jgi:hypothetical protein
VSFDTLEMKISPKVAEEAGPTSFQAKMPNINPPPLQHCHISAKTRVLYKITSPGGIVSLSTTSKRPVWLIELF